MTEKLNIFAKLQKARVLLQAKDIKKSGNNKFAGYKYMELGDFLPPAQEVFNTVGLCPVITFTTEQAKLSIHDIDSDSIIEFTSPMGSAHLKGCHDVQNIGAVETYQRRYLYLVALEITEHDDLDSGKPLEPPNPQPAPNPQPKPKFDDDLVQALRNAPDLNGLMRVWDGLTNQQRIELAEIKDQVKKKLKPKDNFDDVPDYYY